MKAKVLSIITATALFVGGQTYLTKTVLIANAASNTQHTTRIENQPKPMVNEQSASDSVKETHSEMPHSIAQPHYHPVKMGKININNRDWRPNTSDDSYIMNSNLDQENSTSTSSASSDSNSLLN